MDQIHDEERVGPVLADIEHLDDARVGGHRGERCESVRGLELQRHLRHTYAPARAAPRAREHVQHRSYSVGAEALRPAEPRTSVDEKIPVTSVLRYKAPDRGVKAKR